MLNSQEVIGIVIVICVILYFLFNYRRFSGIKSETRLYLKKTRATLDTEASTINSATLMESETVVGVKTKSLNVLFMYNGHSFDAHEILGIPPGSSMKDIDAAFVRLKATINPESREFVETAYQVLKRK